MLYKTWKLCIILKFIPARQKTEMGWVQGNLKLLILLFTHNLCNYTFMLWSLSCVFNFHFVMGSQALFWSSGLHFIYLADTFILSNVHFFRKAGSESPRSCWLFQGLGSEVTLLSMVVEPGTFQSQAPCINLLSRSHNQSGCALWMCSL